MNLEIMFEMKKKNRFYIMFIRPDSDSEPESSYPDIKFFAGYPEK